MSDDGKVNNHPQTVEIESEVGGISAREQVLEQQILQVSNVRISTNIKSKNKL